MKRPYESHDLTPEEADKIRKNRESGAGNTLEPEMHVQGGGWSVAALKRPSLHSAPTGQPLDPYKAQKQSRDR